MAADKSERCDRDLAEILYGYKGYLLNSTSCHILGFATIGNDAASAYDKYSAQRSRRGRGFNLPRRWHALIIIVDLS